MSIVKMKRMKVIALKSDRSELLKQLMSLGCVEISEPEYQLNDPDWTSLLSQDTSELGQVRMHENELSRAREALQRYAQVKGGGLFVRRDRVSEAEFFAPERTENALKNAQEINDAVSALDKLQAQAKRLESQKASLLPWESLDLPLETEGTEHVEIVMGTLPVSSSLEEAKAALAKDAELSELLSVSADKAQQCVLLLCHREQMHQAMECLKPFSFSAARFKGLTGTPRENLAAIDAQLADNAKAQEAQLESIRAHEGCFKELEIITDRLAQDEAREAARERGMTDGTIVFLEGWVPADRAERAERILKGFDAAYSFADPKEYEEPPTLLENAKWMRPINMVTEMYSPPAYDGIDPNPLIFFWYIFFFGFMFADVAYGIIIFLVSHIIIKKYEPKGNVLYLGRWLGASTAICGLFTGGFFGNSIQVVAETFLNIPMEQLPGWLQAFCKGFIVSPIDDPMTVLIMAMAIGFLQLVCGQCIHIYMSARDGDLMGGLLDVVPWWIFLAGIPVALLGNNLAVLILGVIALVLTQGRNNEGIFGKIFGGVASLYDVTSWLSDVLSYARLMALMLATSVIAMVFNTLAALPHIFIVFLIIFIVGHVFNIGVNLIGTYVHAARLQYLEYYGKFYKDGGRFFAPLKYNTKYVDIDEEEN
jgi:V/A-type H+-transporting ATPase subunit I